MIRSFVYKTQGRLHSKDIDTFLMPTLLADTNLFLWVDLEDPTEEEARLVLENVFHFHPLSIEDCLIETSTPKVEEYSPKEEDMFSPYLFIVIHAVDYSRKDGLFATKELNLFLGKNMLVSVHRGVLRSVNFVAESSLHSRTKLAKAPDRLAHTLLDSIVDNYKPALDELGLEIAELEDDVLRNADPSILNKIIQSKKEVLALRQIIGPQREVLSRIAQGEFKLIRPKMIPYFRNVYDGLFQISELAHKYTDSLTGILQVYLNMSANHTADVVKLLTLITVITTPVGLVSSWYGMNFRVMAELDWPHAYMVVLGLTVLATALAYLYFKRKNWF